MFSHLLLGLTYGPFFFSGIHLEALVEFLIAAMRVICPAQYTLLTLAILIRLIVQYSTSSHFLPLRAKETKFHTHTELQAKL
jgi:hypothetical protein